MRGSAGYETVTDDVAQTARATLIGASAILLWSMLALLTTGADGIPPFQLLALTFGIASITSLIYLAIRGPNTLAKLRQRPAAWLLGIGGLFGFHFFYFVALGQAPAVEASLIVYLWPLLIVLLSALLPGVRLRWFHIVGALLGLGGAALLLTNGGRVGFDSRYVGGYLSALGAAVTWAVYSVANRRFGDVPSEAVSGFCAGTALLGALCHALTEDWVQPQGWQWLSILGLGMGPVGAAFFLWDYGTKHGSIQTLGALSYAGPMLSTLLLVAFGKAEPSWVLGVACLMIVGGAILASKQLLQAKAH
jgi:drug/metabolite transporter (DMT)-like permease